MIGGKTLQLVMEGPSTTTTLTGALPSGSTHVAFTVFGWRFSESTVRLYVGGALVAETNEILEALPNEGTIYLGNSEAMDRPYKGTMEGIRLHAQTLTAAEVLAAAQ